MKSILFKLPDELLDESQVCADSMDISRAEYYRRAVVEMNRRVKKEIMTKRIAAASKKVRKESMKINEEFSKVEEDPDA